MEYNFIVCIDLNKKKKELIGASPLALAKSICYQVVLIVCQDIDLFLIALLVVIFSRL